MKTNTIQMPEDPFKFEIYTIYDHPLDYPEHYVIRRYRIEPNNPEPLLDTKFFFQSKEIETCREMMVTMGVTKVPLHEPDPYILENYW